MKQIKKQIEFIWKSVAINLVLYVLMIPFNLLQLSIAFFVKVTVFFTGVNISIIPVSQGLLLKGTNAQIGMMQTFFELLTLASITLALKKNKLFQTMLPVIIYYVALYSAALILFEKNIDATFITDFISYQSRYLILLLLVFWYVINKKYVLEMFK